MMDELPKVNAEDLNSSGWAEIVEAQTVHDCRHYSEAFHQVAYSKGVGVQAAALHLLGDITSMMLRTGAEHVDQPFAAFAVIDGKRTALPEDLSDSNLDALRDFLASVDDVELQARIADLMWVRRREFPSVQVAKDAYLASATRLEAEDAWRSAINRLERALRLSVKTGKSNGTIYSDVIAHLTSLVARPMSQDLKGLRRLEQVMHLLLEFGEGTPTDYAALTQDLAMECAKNQNWSGARTCWALNAAWHEQAGDEVSARMAHIESVRTIESLADDVLLGPSPSHSTAVAYLADATQRMRRLGEAVEAQRLHQRLVEQQALSVGEMVRVTGSSIDLQEAVKSSRRAIQGKSVTDAILELAAMVPRLSELEARRTADEIAQSAPFLGSISSSAVNEYGRVVAQRPSRLSSNPSEAADAIYADMIEVAADFQRLCAHAYVDPARKQLVGDHAVEPNDLYFLLRGSPLVDKGRDGLIARGLHAGLVGDFALALHLLIPQVEHSLRYALLHVGALTSGLGDPTGVQDENNLNTLLSREELEPQFGPDFMFELRVALIERWGHNLRNRLAHGLLSDIDCLSDAARYAWCLILHLYSLPALGVADRGKPEEAADDE